MIQTILWLFRHEFNVTISQVKPMRSDIFAVFLLLFFVRVVKWLSLKLVLVVFQKSEN